MRQVNRTDLEKNTLIKAIDAFGNKFIVISPEFTILAANQVSKEVCSSELVGQKCHHALFKQSEPCTGCPASESMRTKAPAILPDKKVPVDPNNIPCIYAYPFFSDGTLSGIVILDFDIPAFGGMEFMLNRPDFFLKNLILSAVDGVVASDLKGNIIIFNNAASEISGYNESEALNEITIRDLYPNDGAKEIMKKLRSSGHGGKGKLKSYEVNILKKNNDIVPIRLSASIVYEGGQEIATIGFFHDLREEIRMQKELEKAQVQLLMAEKIASQSRIRAIIESLPIGVMVTNENAQVILMNESFKKHMDLQPDCKSGNAIETYVKDNGLCEYVKNISEKQLDTEEMDTYDFALSKNKFLLARGRAVRGEKSEYIGAVTTIVDITAMKVMDRLKSEFIAKVSHELQSPLATIHQQLATVLSDIVNEEFDTDFCILERAKERTKGLISLIKDLLDLSRIEEGSTLYEPKRIHIEEVIDKIIEEQKPVASEKKQSIVSLFTGDSIPPIKIDPIALESVFTNLITNAIHYTQEGGEIIVDAYSDVECIKVQVKDNGLGIEKQHLYKIFDRFYRVQNEETQWISGSGLGLHIVKEILDSINGNISVESSPGKGSTFTVSIPINPVKEI